MNRNKRQWGEGMRVFEEEWGCLVGGEKNASRKYGENVFDRRDGAKQPQVSKTPDGEYSREEDGEAGPFSSRWEATTAARRYGCRTEGQT